MKYSSTHRLINTVLFGILTAGFIALTVFFTFFWGPHAIESHFCSSIDFIDNNKSFAFNANLGILFLALSIVSIFGLVYSIKSLKKSTDDAVVDSFLCYVCLGYVAAIFFVLNAIWLYSLIGTTQATFWIVLCVIAAIGVLIAANVPMMKMLEDDKTNRLSAIVATAFFAVSLSAFVNFGFPLVVAVGSSYSIKTAVEYLAWFTGFAGVGAVLSLVASILYTKKPEKVNLANYLTYSSLIAFAGIPMFSGVNELVLHKNSKASATISILTLDGTYAGKTYCVMAIITASLIVVAAAALFIAGFVADKKEAK